MRYSPVVAVPAAIILVVNLLAVSAAGVRAAQGSGSDLCVAISGGTVSNATVLDVAADGGVAIADASGGTGNAAFLPDNSTDNNGNNGNGNDQNNGNDNGNDNNNGNDHNNGNGNNNRNNNNNDNGNDNRNNTNNNNNDANRNGVGTASGGDASNNAGAGNEQGAVNNTDGTNVNAAVAIIAADWTAEPVRALEARLLQTETASAGNGGVATASADGGVVSIQDINSGGNAGNAIAVGDTVCAEGSFAAPAGGNAGGGNAGGGNAGGGGGRGAQVRALPNTGVGVGEDNASESLLLALGTFGLVALSLGYGYDRRVSRAGGR